MAGTNMSEMHNPPHPGEVLADTVLGEDGGLSVAEFARQLGIARVTLSRVVNGRAAVSVELALRLANALGTSAESWLNMQSAYDLWQATHGGRRLLRTARNPRHARPLRVPRDVVFAFAAHAHKSADAPAVMKRAAAPAVMKRAAAPAVMKRAARVAKRAASPRRARRRK
jgi:addiction module HigA family antidote